ncbi:MAG: 2Fe-2S iron-sulfur cluster-binding protein [Pseudomonadota bacterium]
MTDRRLKAGGLIDRAKRLPFTFDGQRFAGHPGDTISSALLASGVQIVGRGFKFHRPRGLWGAWVDEPNAIFDVILDGVRYPNVPGATTPLQGGMQVRAVNAWPSARFDVKSVLGAFDALLPAGFYYKTFIWPDWHLFEPAIRRLAGLGQLDGTAPDGFISDQRHDRCDLLVVGAGAAGLRAARLAAEAGDKVVLVEDHPLPGGGLFARGAKLEDTAPADWVASELAILRAAGGRLLTETTAFGVYDHGLIGLVRGFGLGKAPELIRMRTDRVILATGALDRPATFPNNDRPGVMSLQAVAEYLGRYGILSGKRIAVLSNHALAKAEARPLEAAGAEVRHLPLSDTVPETIGRRAISGLRVGHIRQDCDVVAVTAGRTPTLHLWRHAGGKLDWDAEKLAFVPGKAPKGMIAIGAANGTFEVDQALDEAAQAAQSRQPAAATSAAYNITQHRPKAEGGGRQFIDFQHDVTLKDIALAARESYNSVEHLKRYTTLGMAVDQGKTSNMPGLIALAALKGAEVPDVGTTTFRPPFVPNTLTVYKGHATGEHFHAIKRLPLEETHRAEGAALGEYGGWLRPGWYGDGDPTARAETEALTARQHAAVFDGSPLGKIEVLGPDAAGFLDFIYYNRISSLKPGAIRYGFMLREDGVIYDDGVVARISDAHFTVSCSSSHVEGVVTHLEAWRQDGNNPDRVFIHDATQAWGTLAISGPVARQVVSAINLDTNLSHTAFAHMQIRAGRFQDAPARLARVSFTGDLSYEISVPPDRTEALWQAAREAGAAPMGIEALSILRAEKGYIVVGKDTDGETMPTDLGITGPRDRKPSPYLGDRGLKTPQAQRTDRQELVGLRVPEGAPPLPTGAHLVKGTGAKRRSIGFVTSSYFSPTLGYPIALALMRSGHMQDAIEVELWHADSLRLARVCSPTFFDPKGTRLHA